MIYRYFFALFLLFLSSTSLRNFANENLLVERFLFENFISSYTMDHLKRIKTEIPENYSEIISKLNYYYDCYQNSKKLEEQPIGNQQPRIPPIIHMIWLGPKTFPNTDVFYRWREHNPDYKIILWTDRVRNPVAPFVEQKPIEELFPLQLEREFYASNNWGEKADILRLAILERFGGIYADVDILCNRSFDALIQHFTFFAGIENITPLTNNRYLRLGNCLIGSIPHHDFILRTMDIIHETWEEKTQFFADYLLDFSLPVDHPFAIQIVLARTFLPFTEAVFSRPLEETEAIFPHYYFGFCGPHFPFKYSTHLFANNWVPEMTQDTNQRSNRQFFSDLTVNQIDTFYDNTKMIIFLLISAFSLACFLLYHVIRKKIKIKNAILDTSA